MRWYLALTGVFWLPNIVALLIMIKIHYAFENGARILSYLLLIIFLLTDSAELRHYDKIYDPISQIVIINSYKLLVLFMTRWLRFELQTTVPLLAFSLIWEQSPHSVVNSKLCTTNLVLCRIFSFENERF